MGDQRLDLAMQDQDWDLALDLIHNKQGLRHTDTGWSVLHTAVWKNAPATVCEQLTYYVDVNKPDDLGDSPIHYAVRFNVSHALLKVLLKAGGDPNRLNLGGHTPLMLGVFTECSVELLLLLLSFHASLEVRDHGGRNAIDWAGLQGRYEVKRELERVRVVSLLAGTSMFKRKGCPVSSLPLDLVRKVNLFLSKCPD